MNKVLLEGIVIRSESDEKKTKFTVATKENYTDKNGHSKEITDYHNCIIWKPINLEKGNAIKLEGKLKTSKYNDKYYTNVVIWNSNDITSINERSDVFNSKANKSKVEEELTDMGFVEKDDVPF